MKIFYTGVGNRDTPHEYLEKMTVLASLLEKEGCILRSGGAEGAETFTSFETVGTGTVIRLANHYNIPVFNLRNKNWADRFKEFMKG